MKLSSFVLPVVLLGAGSMAAYGGLCLGGDCGDEAGADDAALAGTLADIEDEPCDQPCDKAGKKGEPKAAPSVLADVEELPESDSPCPYANKAKADEVLADADEWDDDEPCDGKKKNKPATAKGEVFADAAKAEKQAEQRRKGADNS